MALVGLEVVTTDGRHVGAGRAVLRTICIPLSLILLGIGVLMILIDRRRRALHDLIAGTAVVYAWDTRRGSPALPRQTRRMSHVARSATPTDVTV